MRYALCSMHTSIFLAFYLQMKIAGLKVFPVVVVVVVVVLVLYFPQIYNKKTFK